MTHHSIKNIVLIGFTVGISILTGCASAAPEAKLSAPIVLEAGDLSISLEYLNRSTLRERHGRNNATNKINPFMDFPALLTPKRFVVFEMTASTTESTVLFDLDDLFLSIGGTNGDAKKAGYLGTIWEAYDVDIDAMKKTLKDTVLPDKFEVTPERPVSGYLVFAEGYPPEGGTGELNLTLSTAAGDSGSLSRTIVFGSKNEDVVQEVENTGIFGD